MNIQPSEPLSPSADPLAGVSAKPVQPPPSDGLKRNLGLMMGALGVVFGDIGTSPLYAMRQTCSPPRAGFPITPP